MPAPTERQIRDAIVAVIAANIGTGKAYNRVRFSDSDAAYVKLYVDDDGRVHTYFVRRIAMRLETTNFDDIVSRTHIYEIRGLYGIVDSDTDDLASENIFQLELETIGAALDADKHLGFTDYFVSHSGFEIPLEMPDVVENFGSVKCHGVQARVAVRVEEC